MNDLASTSRRERVLWLRAGGAALAMAVLAAAAPLVWTAVAAGLGIAALLTLVGVGLVVLHALPYVGQRLENALLQARKRAAHDQPIAQLQNELLCRTRQMREARAALATIYAQIQSMQEMLDTRRARDPEHNLAKHEAALQKMSAFYASYAQKLGSAERALEEYERHIEAKLFEHDFARTGQVVLQRLNGADPDAVLRDLLADEASRSIQANFDRVFAELELERHRLPTGSASPNRASQRGRQ